MSEDINPFQSPQAFDAPIPPGGMPGGFFPFESGHARAVWTMVLLGIVTATHLAGLAGVALVDLRDPSRADLIVFALIGVLTLLATLSTIVAFSMWVHRAARNLPALGGRGLKYTPAWAVGWFFIPFANLVMPCLVMNEIWRESDPAQRHLTGRFAKVTSPLVIFWWLAFVSIGILPSIINAANEGASGEFVARSMAGPLATDILSILAGILAIWVVYSADKNQQAKYDLILNEPTLI